MNMDFMESSDDKPWSSDDYREQLLSSVFGFTPDNSYSGGKH